MKKVHFYIGTGFYNARHEKIEEFDDNVTEEELDDYLEDFVADNIDSSWWYEEE